MKEKPDLHFEEAIFHDERGREPGYRELLASRHSFLFIGFIALAFVGLALGKTGFLVFAESALYTERAYANVSREISIPTYRAIVLDRFGEPLVKNASAFSVYVNVPVLVGEPGALHTALDELSVILGIEPAILAETIRSADLLSDNWIAAERNITLAEAIAVRGLRNKAVQVVDDYTRDYVRGAAFAHVLGYTGTLTGKSIVGRAGLEAGYDALIRGEDGRFVFYRDALGAVIDQKLVTSPEPAEPLKTTIDGEFQEYFYNRLSEGLAALRRDSGAGIALDPRSGEVLALVSIPSFDPNVFVDRRRGGERAALLTDTRQPLFNRAISGSYSPGSAIKPLMLVAARREGVVTNETNIYSSGSLEIPNPYVPEKPSVFHDWKAHGWVDAESAIARSSNIYFYLVGGGLPKSVSRSGFVEGEFSSSGLGISKIGEYLKRLGFGGPTGIDLPAEGVSFIPTPEKKKERTGDDWRLGDTYNVSIGQGDLLVTPIQLVSFIASIGNGGYVLKPFLHSGTPRDVLVDYSEWEGEIRLAQNGLSDAVLESYGTAHSLADLPLAVSGKTGSAQIANNAKLNAFFVGYAGRKSNSGDAPHEPEIAVLILVENAREGSVNTLPIAKDVFKWYYDHRIAESR